MNLRQKIMRKCGFTLVELLVVISIIALLLAVLIPSLQRTRAQAKLTVCKNNLNQIGIGIYAYAQSMNDRLPEVYSFSKNGEVRLANNTWPFYVLRHKYNPPEPLAYWGFGKLWERKFLEEPTLYYCPAKIGQRDFYSFYNPKDTARDIVDPFKEYPDLQENLRAYYSYTPLQKSPKRNSSGAITAWPLTKNLVEIGSNTLLSADQLDRFRNLVHKKGSGNSAVAILNLLYGDGRVKSYSNPKILNERSASNLSVQWFFDVAADAM